MLSKEEIEQALLTGYELRGFELKGRGSRGDTHFFAKVARAALSLGNLRDGGTVVIGIDDSDPAAMLPGLEPDELQSWLAYDDVARKLASYADPPLRFNIGQTELSSGAVVVVVEVLEFEDIPHLCAKEYPDVLRKGALYVRSRKVPETAEVASSVEMREILDLATQKALRAFVATAQRADINLAAEAGPSNDERYRQERERGWQ